MQKKTEDRKAVAGGGILLLTLVTVVAFPRLGYLAGCAADVGVRVPGDGLFWFPVLLVPLAWVALGFGLRSGQRRALSRGLLACALALALLSAGTVGNLYWQYHTCGVPFVEMSTNPHSTDWQQ